MGILAGAMSGFGAGLADIGDTNIKADIATKAREQESNLATQRAQTMEVFRNNLAAKTTDDQRTAQTSRIDTAAGQLAEPAIAAKRGIIGSQIASPNDWTDEQQAAVDQSLAIDKAGMVQDPSMRERAAMRTGDISPKESAAIYRDERRLDVSEKRADASAVAAERNEQGRNQRQENYLEAQEKLAEIRAGGANGVNREERIRYTSLMSDTGRRLTEAQKALSTLQKDVASKIAEPGSARAIELDDLKATIKGYEEERKIYQGLLAGSQTNTPAAKVESKPVKSSPYSEGTRLTGPGGKPYIVKNGVPVPL